MMPKSLAQPPNFHIIYLGQLVHGDVLAALEVLLDGVQKRGAVISLGVLPHMHGTVFEVALLMTFGEPVAVACPSRCRCLLCRTFFHYRQNRQCRIAWDRLRKARFSERRTKHQIDIMSISCSPYLRLIGAPSRHFRHYECTAPFHGRRFRQPGC